MSNFGSGFIHAHNFAPSSVMGFSMMVCTICGASQASVQQDIGGWAPAEPERPPFG